MKPGDVVGNWAILESIENERDRYHRYHRCRCQCGTVRVVQETKLKSGRWQSCGCIFPTNGMPEWKKALRRIWLKMIDRCQNPANKGYPRYGKRGIRVCESWRDSFDAFCTNMGPRPSAEHSIDRIDNDGNYEPNNCRWATRTEQARNRSDNHEVTIGGLTKCLKAWVVGRGIAESVVHARIKLGWRAKQALSVPVNRHNLDGRTESPPIAPDGRWKRKSLLTVGEKTLEVREWAEQIGIEPNTLLGRLQHGWSPIKAITIPIRSRTLKPKTSILAL